ncbi:BREX-2 system phosphatase PglZ [Sorangium sp. So ce1014]|uniref:BREX-2 system phosphatase PglZ n=1 Tax=Sorangium sp. So ce1014 TaxID=3133326 RepID=UPI003F618BCB
MSLDLPTLSTSDLQEELRQIHRHTRRSFTAAVACRGEPGWVSVDLYDKKVLFRVEPVRSELQMRRVLAEDGEDPVILLVDFEQRLPADLAGRLAGGKVHPVDRGRQLARMFGAAATSSELQACRPLCDALRARAVPSWRSQGSTVDLETAWRALLARDAGIPFEGALTEERVVDFCASSPVVPAFVKALADNGPLRAALLQHLDEASGPVAAIAWRAWERGEGRAVAALALVLEVAAKKLSGHAYLLGQVRTAMARLDPELRKLSPDAPLFGRWGELGPVMARRLAPPVLDRALADADAILQDEPVADVLVESRWLPRAFELSAKALGDALVAATATPTPDAIERADEASKRLQNHRRARVDDSNEKRLAARAEMALKLVAYLGTRPQLEAELRELGDHDRMRSLAEHYAEHGAHVDAARAVARGEETAGALAQGIQAALTAVDAARDLDDERFANGLASWVQAGSPGSSRVVPIERALDEFGVGFLREKPHRKLLVVLLDGMAWANAVELLTSLEEAHVAPIRWKRGRLPPVLAALPTVTTVSRAALFKGKRLDPGEAEDTGKDPARFAGHKGLTKLLDQAPQLYLRPDVETTTGELSKKAAALVQSKDRVVAVVVNAIDDQLKGSRQMRVPCDLGHIKPLGPLLQEATDAGRAVLLVADHGHVLGARLASVSAPEAGPKRWRPLGVNDAPGPNEVCVSTDSTWRPRGKAKVALLYRETEAYGGSAHVGEHGGASLAEVVSPAFLVASDRLRQRIQLEEGEDDEALEVTPFQSPPWWDLRVRKPAVRTVPVDAVVVVEPSPAPARQLSIPLVDVAAPKPSKERKDASRPAAAASGAPAAARQPGPSAALARSKLLKERQRERGAEPRAVMMAWIDVLAAHQGRMAARRFTHEVGLLAHQAGGAVSEMGEWLNVDTYQVVTYDRVAQEVLLDLDLLQGLFGAD